MKTDINKDKIIQSIRDFYRNDNALKYYLDRNKANILLDYITNLQQENKQLKEDKKKAIEYIGNVLCNSKAQVRNDISGKEIDNLIEILEGKENE